MITCLPDRVFRFGLELRLCLLRGLDPKRCLAPLPNSCSMGCTVSLKIHLAPPSACCFSGCSLHANFTTWDSLRWEIFSRSGSADPQSSLPAYSSRHLTSDTLPPSW